MKVKEKFLNKGYDLEKIKNSFGAAFLLSFTLFFFGPTYMYYQNILEVPYFYIDMIWVFLLYSIIAVLIVFAILFLMQGNIHQKAVVLVFALGLLFWIQGNILVWDYGILDGREIIWNDYFLNGIIDLSIWISILIIAFFKSSSFYKHIAVASCILLIIQGGGLAAEILQAPDEPEWKSYSIGYDDEAMFEFSQEENVIILVLDMFQSDVFQEIIEEDKDYYDVFDGFTYYRNAVSGFSTTYPSVTYLLTGQYYDNSIPIQEFIKISFLNNSIPQVLKNNGYQVDLYPISASTIYYSDNIASNLGTQHSSKIEKAIDGQKVAGELLQLTIFRDVPHFLKRQFYFIPFIESGDEVSASRDVLFYNSLLENSITSDNKKIFKYYHLIGAHAPYTLNSELQNEVLPQNRSGCKEQSKAALKIAEELINQLKKNDVYDNSLIFIVADHGNPWGNVGLNIEPLNETNGNTHLVDKKVVTSGIPLVLVKPFNSTGFLQISDAPITNGEIPQTIASELDLTEEFLGESILSVNESDERIRKHYQYKLYDTWDQEYLPDMEEYEVNGHSWLYNSWESTNQIYKKGEIVGSSYVYESGNPISFGINGSAQQYEISGWSNPEEDFTWTDNYNAVLRLQSGKTDKDLSLTIMASPYLGEGLLDHQRVNISVNNYLIGEWILSEPGIQEKTIIIPNSVLNEDTQYISFELNDARSPNSLGLSNDGRDIALAFNSIIVTEDVMENEFSLLNEDNNFILFGKNGSAQKYEISGWSNPEEGFTWTDNYNAVLRLQSGKTDKDLSLTITASPYLGEGLLDHQRVNISVNNYLIGEWILSEPGFQEKTIIIPNSVLNEDTQYISFELNDAKSPNSLGLSNDERNLGIAFQSIILNNE